MDSLWLKLGSSASEGLGTLPKAGHIRGRKKLAKLEFRWMEKLSYRGADESGTGSEAKEIVWLMP